MPFMSAMPESICMFWLCCQADPLMLTWLQGGTPGAIVPIPITLSIYPTSGRIRPGETMSLRVGLTEFEDNYYIHESINTKMVVFVEVRQSSPHPPCAILLLLLPTTRRAQTAIPSTNLRLLVSSTLLLLPLSLSQALTCQGHGLLWVPLPPCRTCWPVGVMSASSKQFLT